MATALNNLALLLRDTNRLAEAEPLSRRMVLIFLAFTRDTGHTHPHLAAAFGNYHALLAAMDLDAAEQARRLAALGAEAGLDDAAYRQLLSDPGAGAAPGTASPHPGGARGGIRTAATALLRALGLRRPG